MLLSVDFRESTETSVVDRCGCSAKQSAVNSPARMKPINSVHNAAQSITLSNVRGCLDHNECMS